MCFAPDKLEWQTFWCILRIPNNDRLTLNCNQTKPQLEILETLATSESFMRSTTSACHLPWTSPTNSDGHTLCHRKLKTSSARFIVFHRINYSISHLDFIKHPICRNYFSLAWFSSTFNITLLCTFEAYSSTPIKIAYLWCGDSLATSIVEAEEISDAKLNQEYFHENFSGHRQRI